MRYALNIQMYHELHRLHISLLSQCYA